MATHTVDGSEILYQLTWWISHYLQMFFLHPNGGCLGFLNHQQSWFYWMKVDGKTPYFFIHNFYLFRKQTAWKYSSSTTISFRKKKKNREDLKTVCWTKKSLRIQSPKLRFQSHPYSSFFCSILLLWGYSSIYSVFVHVLIYWPLPYGIIQPEKKLRSPSKSWKLIGICVQGGPKTQL